MKRVSDIFALSLFLSLSSFAGEYAVVSNKNMKELSVEQIKAIFLKKITLINNVEVIPLNLEAKDELRVKFEKQVLNMSFTKLKTYWIQEHYLGRRPPISMKSQESIKAFISKVEGSIAYINAENIDENMKVLYTWRD